MASSIVTSLYPKVWTILRRHSKRATSYYSRNFISNIPDQLFCKLTQKGFVTYSFLDSFAKLEEPLADFGDSWKNSLTGKIDNTLQDYQHALDIYNKFGCTNLGDYHDVYLKTDVLLLADILEKFRSVCLSVYQLDPAHFYSAPNLRWESMLISARVKLGLVEDVDMLFLAWHPGWHQWSRRVAEFYCEQSPS